MKIQFSVVVARFHISSISKRQSVFLTENGTSANVNRRRFRKRDWRGVIVWWKQSAAALLVDSMPT